MLIVSHIYSHVHSKVFSFTAAHQMNTKSNNNTYNQLIGHLEQTWPD